MEQIAEYGHKAKVLRQIMSNKARFYARVNGAQNLLTVVLTSFLGFIGFSGMDKVQIYLGWFMDADKLKVELAFNLLVFGLFVLATLHLLFHFGKKQTDAERAVVDLTNVINHIEDLLAKEDKGLVVLNIADLDATRLRYDAVTRNIPANSDAEYVRAKADIQQKDRRTARLSLTPQALFDERQRQQALRALILRSAHVMQILQAIQQVDERLYLGGGLVRNLVWDYLHDFRSPTPIDDVDVVYFDTLAATKDHDLQLQTRLRGLVQNLQWSVKNQARMHIGNGDNAYTGVEDAVSKWPETATCIAVRLSKSGELEVLTPHGLSDLFRLVIRPTAHFESRPQRVHERAQQKRWLTTWPKLTLIAAAGN